MRSKKPKHVLKVRQTKYGAGKGLYTESPIKKGEFVVEYTGKKIPTVVADTLGTRYLFDLENGWTIDGSPMTNLARWVNHACDPNCEAELDEDAGRVFYEATRNIEPGEELTIDYGEEYFDEFIKPYGCKCAGCTEKREKKEAREKKKKVAAKKK